MDATIQSLDNEQVAAPTWVMDENGNATAVLPINGQPTKLVMSEPTMNTLDKLAIYIAENPGSAIKSQLLCISETLIEPQGLTFQTLCNLPFREGKEVLKGLKMFPDYSEG